MARLPLAAPSSPRLLASAIAASILAAACSTAPAGTDSRASAVPSTLPTSPAAVASRAVRDGLAPVRTGEPIELADLDGRIVTDDFEDVFAFDVDGSHVQLIAGAPGSEFDGTWSPDGEWVVYRDSTRGINENDEVFLARADGSEPRNISNDPANDWGPDWSPDGSTIAFNSDRDGRMAGFLVDPDGSNLRKLDLDVWFEYPSWSPDGTRITFMGHTGGSYEVFVLELSSGEVTQLTDAPGDDSWPAWSPDGSIIAFSTERDDCRFAAPGVDCWDDGEPNDEHRDVWLMDTDGANPRRVTSEAGQFVAWSPDGRYLLISGRALYVVRPDGTGRLELRAEGTDRALGGIPDWRSGG